jgi:myo-inositol 2-dehydrogenase/D-chiro-inositol 1-dehydrogenase
VTVSAEASALTDPAIAGIGDIDTAVVTMRTASGKIAVITNSRRASIGYDQWVEAHGALGHATNRERARQHDVLETADGVRRSKPLFFFAAVRGSSPNRSLRLPMCGGLASAIAAPPAHLARASD